MPFDDRLVVSELGASTTNGFSEADQARWLTEQMHAVDVGDSPYQPNGARIDAVFIHEPVEDVAPDYEDQNWQAGFGLVRVKNEDGEFALKPAYCAIRAAFSTLAGCPATLPSAP